MKIHFTFRKVDERSRAKLHQCFSGSKLNRLTRLLNHGNLEIADLDIRTEYFQKHNAFLMKLELKIKGYKLIGEETSHDIIKVFDLASEKLISRVRKIESLKHKKRI